MIGSLTLPMIIAGATTRRTPCQPVEEAQVANLSFYHGGGSRGGGLVDSQLKDDRGGGQRWRGRSGGSWAFSTGVLDHDTVVRCGGAWWVAAVARGLTAKMGGSTTTMAGLLTVAALARGLWWLGQSGFRRRKSVDHSWKTGTCRSFIAKKRDSRLF